MRSNFESYGTALALAILALVPMLVLMAWAIAVSEPAVAENGASQTAPQRSAKPAMPAVPGTPEGGSAASRPSGPTGGSPGRGPEVL